MIFGPFYIPAHSLSNFSQSVSFVFSDELLSLAEGSYVDLVNPTLVNVTFPKRRKGGRVVRQAGKKVRVSSPVPSSTADEDSDLIGVAAPNPGPNIVNVEDSPSQGEIDADIRAAFPRSNQEARSPAPKVDNIEGHPEETVSATSRGNEVPCGSPVHMDRSSDRQEGQSQREEQDTSVEADPSDSDTNWVFPVEMLDFGVFPDEEQTLPNGFVVPQGAKLSLRNPDLSVNLMRTGLLKGEMANYQKFSINECMERQAYHHSKVRSYIPPFYVCFFFCFFLS